jgi:hypothetical protein
MSFVALLLSAGLPLAAQVSPSRSPSQSAGAPTSQSPAVALSSPSPIGDTTALAKEAQGWLIDMVRTNTTNPPGSEQSIAKYLAHILDKEGIQSEMLDLSPGRSALVARLRSSAVADPSKALLLVAHMDVVGVDRPKWTVDPFAAVIKDGYLYGRGSIGSGGSLSATFRFSRRVPIAPRRELNNLAQCASVQGTKRPLRVHRREFSF